jgi:hypothetical protein
VKATARQLFKQLKGFKDFCNFTIAVEPFAVAVIPWHTLVHAIITTPH